MSELLRGHLQTVEQSHPEGGEKSLDPHFYSERDAFHEQNYLRAHSGDLPLHSLQTALTFISFLAVPTAIYVGFDHWMTPIAVAAGAVLFPALMPALRRVSSRELAKKDREAESRDDYDAGPPRGGASKGQGVAHKESLTGRRDRDRIV
jgi:hypothetical protein